MATTHGEPPDEQRARLNTAGQKTIIFYEDEITVVLVENNGQETYTSQPGLSATSWAGQRRRILCDPVLAEELTREVVRKTVDLPDVDSD